MKPNKVLMTVLLLSAQAAAVQHPAYGAPPTFYDVGHTIIDEMSQTLTNSFFSSISFDSQEELISFINYFRREYYNGSQPLTFQYAVQSEKYRVMIEAPCSLERAAREHLECTEEIQNIARSLSGKSEMELADSAAAYVESILEYDYDVCEMLEQGTAGAAAGLYKTVGYSLSTGSAICYDYALLMQRILQNVGIPAAVAMNASHAFNLVRIHGRDYICDLTAADAGYGEAAMNIPFTAENLDMLQDMTGADYTVTVIFPEDAFEIPSERLQKLQEREEIIRVP